MSNGTTVEILRDWLKEGTTLGATHMIVATDTFTWEDYPVFVLSDADVHVIMAKYDKIMEVYSYKLDLEAQLREQPFAYHPD